MTPEQKLDTDVSVFLAGYEFDLECESVFHVSHPDLHNGPAAFMQIGPCGHTTGFRCATAVESHNAGKFSFMCRECNRTSTASDFTFIPLDAS